MKTTQTMGTWAVAAVALCGLGVVCLWGVQVQDMQQVFVPPENGTFFLLSAESEDGSPPYPYDPYGGVMPVHQMKGFPNHYLVADSVEDFQALQALQAEMSAEFTADGMTMNSLEFPGEGEGGGGGGGGESSSMVFGTNDLWLEITNVTNSAASFVIHTPDVAAYDLFSTTNLALDVPGLNATNWVWLLRTDVGQTNITIINIWPEIGFFRLGTMLDSDFDGLTDAYELLVSHTNPANPDTDGDGLSDYYEVLAGLPPLVGNAVPSLGSISIPTCPVP